MNDLEKLKKRYQLAKARGMEEVASSTQAEIILACPKSEEALQFCLNRFPKPLRFPLSEEQSQMLKQLYEHHGEFAEVKQLLKEALPLELKRALKALEDEEVEHAIRIANRLVWWSKTDLAVFEKQLNLVRVRQYLKQEQFQEAEDYLAGWKGCGGDLETWYTAQFETLKAQGQELNAEKFLLDWEIEGVYLEQLKVAQESNILSLRSILLDLHEAEGLQEGEKIGIEKGKKQEKRAIAKNMLKAGVAPEIVMQSTGLSEEAIEQIVIEW